MVKKFWIFGQAIDFGKRTFAGYEGDELAHAFLHALLRFFCYFGILGQCQLHDSRDWSKVTDVSV